MIGSVYSMPLRYLNGEAKNLRVGPPVGLTAAVIIISFNIISL